MVVKRIAVLVIAGVVGGLLAAGCGGASIGGICQKACECATTCKNTDLTTCETDGEQAQQAAEKAGCGSQFDDELACLDGLTCKDHMFESTPCESEILAVGTCVDKTAPPPG